jgi:hypothetical protein
MTEGEQLLLDEQRARIVTWMRSLAVTHEARGVPREVCFAIRSVAGMVERRLDGPPDPAVTRAWYDRLDDLLGRSRPRDGDLN